MYIFCSTAKAEALGLITANTTRRKSTDGTEVILLNNDLANLEIEISREVDGILCTVPAETLEEKVNAIGASMLDADQARVEITKEKWN